MSLLLSLEICSFNFRNPNRHIKISKITKDSIKKQANPGFNSAFALVYIKIKSNVPWSKRISGKSFWNKKWIDIEFDPVMEIDLSPEWKTLDDYSSRLRKKSRAKLRL
mgnify:CR=1 FL=1